jgi:aldose sugar dehydrogenase
MLKLLMKMVSVAFVLLFNSNITLSQDATEGVVKDVTKDIGDIVSQENTFRLELVANTGDVPFGMDFLPDGRLLVSSRTKETINIVDIKSGDVTKLEGFSGPHYDPKQAGGMLDIYMHPDYAKNGWIYYSYSGAKDEGFVTEVKRSRIKGNRFVDSELIFQSSHPTEFQMHHSARLAIKDGYLFIADGDRVKRRDLVMDMTSTLGKIVRLHDDGRVPDDNPFVGTMGHHPAIWTLGHRDPQGLRFNPFTGDLWSHEHGPKGGDEINIIRAGRNYGWPVITYGEEYEGGPVGEGLYVKDGMEQPVYMWKPSIAPSSMLFYTGDKYKNWHGNLFIGAMAGAHLNRLTLYENRVIHEERLLADQGWRVRIVRQGLDGYIYIGIDQGSIMRLVQVDAVVATSP